MYILLALTLALACGAQLSPAAASTCRTDDGKPVDWYLAYKFPLLTGRGGHFETGDAYAYITSGTVAKIKADQADAGWKFSQKAFTDPSSMVMRTVAEGFSRAPNIHRIFYNNLPASNCFQEPSATRAHSKGMLVMDEDTQESILLSHSVPQFPGQYIDKLEFPEEEKKRGHVFLCISVDLEQSGIAIAQYLGQLNPQFVAKDISYKIQKTVPKIGSILLAVDQPESERSKVCIQSRKGKEFCLYAKSHGTREDIYSKWLNNDLASDLSFLGYRSGFKGSMPNACYEHHKVSNARRMKVNPKLEGVAETVMWSSVQQAGKLAWTSGQDKQVVCVGDADRRQDQLGRAVGAICFEEPSVWSALQNSVSEFVAGCEIQDLPDDQ